MVGVPLICEKREVGEIIRSPGEVVQSRSVHPERVKRAPREQGPVFGLEGPPTRPLVRSEDKSLRWTYRSDGTRRRGSEWVRGRGTRGVQRENDERGMGLI